MTPKEKAEELINKFILYTEKYSDGWIESDLHAAKKIAIITLDEMEEVYASEVCAILKSKEKAQSFKSKYLLEVKKEILKF